METVGEKYLDDLTNLYNRRYLALDAEEKLKYALSNNTPLSVFIIDLDQFKYVNDTFGHTRGDFLLKEIGNFLKNSFRFEDTVFRYGGDEFVCLLPGVDYAKALKIAERLIAEVNSREFAGIKLTLSIGISSFPEHALEWKTLFEFADKSLYDAKRKGRNRVGVFGKQDAVLTIPTARLIGRNSEIEKVRNYISGLLSEKKGGSIFIGGQVGIGKTRLVREILNDSAFSSISVLTSNLSAATQSIAYYPFREFIQTAINNWGSELFSKISNVYKIEIAKLVPQLSVDFGYLDTNISFLDKFRLFEGVKTIFVEYCKNNPIFLFIDNLHWADINSLELLQYLVRAMKDNKIIFFLVYRTEELKTNNFCQSVIQLIARENLCNNLELTPLDFNESNQMLTHILNSNPPTELVEYIHRATGGNPFFIEELIKSLESSRAIFYDQGIWKFNRSRKFVIPYSVVAVVERKFNMLNEETKNVLEHISVINRNFDMFLLKGITGLNEGQLFDLIDEMIKSGFLINRGDNYYFPQDVIREVVYNKISEIKLRHFHRKIGEYLLNIHLKNPDSIIEELAHHFYYGGDRTRAIEYNLLAGDKAKNAYAYQSAMEFYSQAFEYLKDSSELQEQERAIECLIKRSDVLNFIGEYEEALCNLKDATRRVESIDNKKLKADCLFCLANIYLRMDEYEISKQHAEKALAIYEELTYEYGKMTTLNTIGVVNWYLGNYYEVIKYSQDSLNIARKINDRKYEGINYHTIANAYALLGDAPEAIRHYQESLSIAKEIGNLFEQARILNNIGVAYREGGEYSEALKCHFDSLKIFKDIGVLVWQALNLTNIGAVYMKQGEITEALHYYQQSIEIAREISDANTIIENCVRIGEIYVATKDFINAEKNFNEAYAIARDIGYKYGQAMALEELIALTLDKGNLVEAEKYLKIIAPLVEELNSKDTTADFFCSWGRLYTIRKDWASAEDCFKNALSLFDESKNRFGSAVVSYFYGLLFKEKNDEMNSKKYLSRAREIFAEIGAKTWLKELDEKFDPSE